MRILIGFSGRKTVYGDFDHRQVGIAIESAALNSNMWRVGRTIYSSDWDRFRRFNRMPGFFWRQAIECLVRTLGVVPCLVLVKSLLDTARCRWPQGGPLPQAKCFEESLDLAIEGWCADLATDILDA